MSKVASTQVSLFPRTMYAWACCLPCCMWAFWFICLLPAVKRKWLYKPEDFLSPAFTTSVSSLTPFLFVSFQELLNWLMAALHSTSPHFIYCIAPKEVNQSDKAILRQSHSVPSAQAVTGSIAALYSGMKEVGSSQTTLYHSNGMSLWCFQARGLDPGGPINLWFQDRNRKN